MSRPQQVFRSLSRGGITVAAVAVTALIVSTVTSTPSPTIAAIGEALGAGGEFHRIDPDRIFDSREPAPLDVAPFGRKSMTTAAQSPIINIPTVGVGGLPDFLDENDDGQDDNVLAVAVNITVIQPSHIGYVRAFGTGATEGTTSVVNFFPGQVRANTAIIRPGIDGEISLRFVSPSAPGTTDVAVDILGWFSTSTYDDFGSRVVPIAPIRVYDSALPQFGGGNAGDRAQVSVPIRGAGDVTSPATVIVPNNQNVVGAMVNVTAVNAFAGSKITYLSALPERVADGARPKTSTVNVLPGEVRANVAIVPVGADGSITLFNLQGETRMVMDVLAYLETSPGDDSRAGRVVPLVAPFRAFDTREPEFQDQPLGPAGAEDFSFESFIADVQIGGEPVGPQSALIGNLTAASLLRRQLDFPPAKSFMTAFPTPSSGNQVPSISNLNIDEGDTVPNLALMTYGARPAPAGDGRCEQAHCIRFFNRDGFVDYLLDVYAVVLSD